MITLFLYVDVLHTIVKNLKQLTKTNTVRACVHWTACFNVSVLCEVQI